MFSTQVKTPKPLANNVGICRHPKPCAAGSPNVPVQTFRGLARHDISQLQGRLGNRAVAQMFRDGAFGQVVQKRHGNTTTKASAPDHALPDKRANASNVGLPDGLKSGIEQLSGYSMDDVRVHYNSAKPAELNALAYAQGTDIHLATGQEKHLPHEAWHVVQQMQGRVQPTVQLKGAVHLNDDAQLEHEADLMGGRAIQNRAGVDGGRALRRVVSASRGVVQGVLNEMDASFVRQYIAAQFYRMLSLIESMGIQVTPVLYQNIFRAVNRVQQHAIEAFSDSWPALQYVNRSVQQGMSAVREMRLREQTTLQRDPAFELYQWEYLMPMMAHIQSAGVFEHALLGNPSTLTFGGSDHVNDWLSDPTIALTLFRELHQSTQGLLWFSNMMQAQRQRGSLSTAFQVDDGLDLLNTVGRLSMMIADMDFLPYWDTRALPHNWTSDEFLDARQSRPGFSPQILERIKQELLIARKARHKEELEKASQNQGNAEALDKTRDPEDNTRKDFRYQLDIPMAPGHSAKVFNSGALRLEFSNARRILNLINPGAQNEDLSYENIVAYLNYLQGQGPMLNHDMRTVFQHMGSANSFLRELALLLIGIEGTQNNVMAMHGPMVMDLASQGGLTWNQALFTGSRSPSLKSMPFFVYASDATQKGTNKGSAGPMERQSELIRTGEFSEVDLATEKSIITGRQEQAKREAQNKVRLQELQRVRALRIKDVLQSMKGSIDGEVQKLGEKPAGKAAGIAWEKSKAEITRKYKTMAEGIVDEELKKHPQEDLLGESDFRPSDLELRSMGYRTFKEVYMKRQFELQHLFLNTFFPQLHSLNFGEGPKGEQRFIDFVRRLMEHYMIYRFMGTGKRANEAHRLWSNSRAGIEEFLYTRAEKKPQSSKGPLDLDAQLEMRVYLEMLDGGQYLWNNCLIYAITDAAGIRPTNNDIVTLRTGLGIGAGQMVGAELDFRRDVVERIMNHFGLSGTVELYTGDDTTTPTATIPCGVGPVYKIHYANHHFTML